MLNDFQLKNQYSKVMDNNSDGCMYNFMFNYIEIELYEKKNRRIKLSKI